MVGPARDVFTIWRRNSPASPLFWAAVVLYNLTLGLALVVGGPGRIRAPSYAIWRDYGGDDAWGIALLIGAGLVLVAAAFGPRYVAWAIGLIGAVHLMEAAGFIAAARMYPEAALTAPTNYLFIAVAHGLLAAHYLRCAPRRRS